MANLKVENSLDTFGKSIVRLAKKKGDIKLWEAFEAMVKADKFGHYMMHIFVTEEVPEDLYDESSSMGKTPVGCMIVYLLISSLDSNPTPSIILFSRVICIAESE